MNRPALQLTAPLTPRTIKPRRVNCDDRCRYARGPDCNCKCGGAHHGEAWNTDDRQNDLFTLIEG